MSPWIQASFRVRLRAFPAMLHGCALVSKRYSLARLGGLRRPEFFEMGPGERCIRPELQRALEAFHGAPRVAAKLVEQPLLLNCGAQCGLDGDHAIQGSLGAIEYRIALRPFG